MTFSEAIEKLRREDVSPHLERARVSGFICPHCGSGVGPHGTGAVHVYPETGTASCFACGKRVDVIDVYRFDTGSSFSEAVKALADERGWQLEGGGSWQRTAEQDFAPIVSGHSSLSAEEPAKDAPARDYSAYYARCVERLQQSDEAQAYLTGRGISLETALRCGVGYDPAADPAGAPGAAEDAFKPHPAPRIILPTSSTHYVGRSIDPNTLGSFAKMNNRGGKPGIFNQRALWEGDAVFVTEGAFDALSVIEAGAAAVALNSANNVDALLKLLEARPTKATLLLSLDNDAAGKRAQDELRAGLNRLGIANAGANICGSFKDANAHLTGNRAAFVDAVRRAQSAQGARPDNVADFISFRMIDEIERVKAAGERMTGFPNLDAVSGGLQSGLYVLAAASSLGKTTFALQLCDNLAAAGHDVIFFSLEMAVFELVSKSIARTTAQANMQTAVSALSIRKGYLPENVMDAMTAYKNAVGNRLSIVEGNFSCSVDYIAGYVRDYVRRTGAVPVVCIDYLQIVQPPQDGKSRAKREEVDLVVTALKQLSRELGATIIVISAINRANYALEFSYESIKESGGVEYSGDCVWGLQLACLDEKLFANSEKDINAKRKRIAEAKAENPRRIKLVCLKNRSGLSSYECRFLYYARYDMFVPDVTPPATEPAPAHAAAKRFTASGKSR